MDTGLALWNMQSTAAAPASFTYLYQSMIEDATLAEELGFDSFWFGEHRFWYDGWCPAPLLAAAAATGATTRLRVGTAMLLLPQHDPGRIAHEAIALHRSSGGRLELGVGLGYRDEEFDGLGVDRTRRGRLMDAGLDRILGEWKDAASSPGIWVGGMAEAALDRAAQRGLSFILPPTMKVHETAAAVERIRAGAEAAGVPCGRIGMIRDTWVAPSDQAARDYFLPRLTVGYREYGVAWWIFKGEFTGTQRPDLMERQVDRAVGAALVGSPGHLIDELGALEADGIDMIAFHMHRDMTRDGWAEAVRLLGSAVLPALGWTRA